MNAQEQERELKKIAETKPVFFVLDDVEENLSAATAAFSERAKVVTARSYEEGLLVLKREDPDIVFLDLNFPRREGEKPQRLGEEFRDEVLVPREISNVIITGGFHHQMESTEFVGQLAFLGDPAGYVERITAPAGQTKNRPETWLLVWRLFPENIMEYLKVLRYTKERKERKKIMTYRI